MGTAGSVRGTLRASVNPIFSRHVLAPRLPEFVARFPDLTTIIVQRPDAGDLVAEGMDVAIRFGPQPPSSLSSRLLLRTRVLTVAAPAYLEQRGRPSAPEALTGHDCIQFLDPQRQRPFAWEFLRDGEMLPVATQGPLTFADVDTMVAACVAGAASRRSSRSQSRACSRAGRWSSCSPTLSFGSTPANPALPDPWLS